MGSLAASTLTLVVLQSTAAIEIAPDVLLLPGHLEKDRSPAGNSVVLRGTEGLVVVDTGRGDAHTRALLAIVDELGGGLRAVIDTHWHLDHIGGNAAFRERFPDASLFAHPAIDGALAGFHRESRENLEALLPTLDDRPELEARVATEIELLKLDRALASDEAIEENVRLELAGRALELHVETRAVSDGDIWIVDSASGVLVAGDLVTLPVPLFDTACPEGWREALDRVAAADFEVLVPGHGPPLDREEVSAYRVAFGRLLDCAASDRDDDACMAQWLGGIDELAEVGDDAYPRELLAYYLREFLRPGAAGRTRWCGAR